MDPNFTEYIKEENYADFVKNLKPSSFPPVINKKWLEQAALRNLDVVVSVLLEHGADPNKFKAHPALFWACVHDNEMMVRILLGSGNMALFNTIKADPNVVDPITGRRPIELTTNKTIIDLLFKAGAISNI